MCARVSKSCTLYAFLKVRPAVQAGLFVAAGVDKVRLTGGEPTLRRDLPALVGRLAALPGLAAVGLTTNGLTLARQLPELRDAGAAPWPMLQWSSGVFCTLYLVATSHCRVAPAWRSCGPLTAVTGNVLWRSLCL